MISMKVWPSVIWAVALASGCSSQPKAASEPTAAAGAANAGAPATTGAPAGTPSQSSVGSISTPPPTAAAGSSAKPALPVRVPVAGSVSAGQAGGSGQAATSAAAAGASGAAGSAAAPSSAEQPAAGFDYPSGEVAVTSDLVIPAGKTVRVGPGTKFNASMDKKVQVLGELIVQGSAEAPASFVGGGVPRSWHGIVVESGGKLTLEHAQISGASYGLWAMPGSQFKVDSSVIDTRRRGRRLAQSRSRRPLGTSRRSGTSDTSDRLGDRPARSRDALCHTR
jgi:hypothetical protein